MDVDWSKTQKGKENYNLKAVQDFEDAGVNHVRIRIIIMTEMIIR
jgi:hypothetical protein